MENRILDFIKIFNSTENVTLFTECACYYFAIILHERFPESTIVYDPANVHFAVEIDDQVYDITGRIKDPEDYIPWGIYDEDADFAEVEMIRRNCIDIV